MRNCVFGNGSLGVRKTRKSALSQCPVLYTYIYIYLFISVCVCVCARARVHARMLREFHGLTTVYTTCRHLGGREVGCGQGCCYGRVCGDVPSAHTHMSEILCSVACQERDLGRGTNLGRGRRFHAMCFEKADFTCSFPCEGTKHNYIAVIQSMLDMTPARTG